MIDATTKKDKLLKESVSPQNFPLDILIGVLTSLVKFCLPKIPNLFVQSPRMGKDLRLCIYYFSHM